MALHSSLTGSDLHEPKGVAAAAADTVYIANGAGSGAWTAVTYDLLTGIWVCKQRFYASSTAATALGVIPVDTSIPQNTEGTEIYTQAITPTTTTSKILIRAAGCITRGTSARVTMAIFKDSVADAIGVAMGGVDNGGYPIDENLSGFWEFTSGSTTARTYKLRAGGDGSATWNSVTFGGIPQGGFYVEEWISL